MRPDAAIVPFLVDVFIQAGDCPLRHRVVAPSARKLPNCYASVHYVEHRILMGWAPCLRGRETMGQWPTATCDGVRIARAPTSSIVGGSGS